MKTLLVKHVDAFTRTPFAGNPAGVVVDAGGLTDALMQRIAREKNLSETAFILPPTTGEADLRVRWFTATNEVDLCGHATIASFHALSEEKMFGMKDEGRYRFTIETRSGHLGVTVDASASGGLVEFELPVPSFRPLGSGAERILEPLGLGADDLAPDLPIVVDSYVYVPMLKKERLFSLKPDISVLSSRCQTLNAGGVCVFTLETVDPGSSVHSRFFAPSLGVDEDPVTGSANGPLGVYLRTIVKPAGMPIHQTERPDGRLEYIGEQGDAIGRPGRVTIRLAAEDDRVQRVWIAGHAVTIMDSRMKLEELT